jgi:hypothetical protein
MQAEHVRNQFDAALALANAHRLETLISSLLTIFELEVCYEYFAMSKLTQVNTVLFTQPLSG